MSGRALIVAMRLALAGAGLAALAGCTWDYLNHEDRVSYRAGDAVAANLERATINPSKRSMYDTRGLGRTGAVFGPDSGGAAPAAAPANGTSDSGG